MHLRPMELREKSSQSLMKVVSSRTGFIIAERATYGRALVGAMEGCKSARYGIRLSDL